MDPDPTLHDSDSQRRRAAPALVGRRIGNYTIRRLIAQGGMGAVYEAFHEGLRRPVALKTLLGGLQDTPQEDVQRFLNEARVLARLDHPNIVPVLDVGESNGVLFLAMELIRGQTLYDLIRAQGTLDEDLALDLVRQSALGLQHAHQHGVLHRDLKPANILLEGNGTARLTDFGVAKASGNKRLTATGTALGTPNYMSPEQAMGKNEELDGRSDVWGLGAILYECLTGLPPHNRGSAVETMQAIVREDVPQLHTVVPGITPEVEALCMKCLVRDRGQRYGSANELAEDIRRLLEGDTLQGVPAAKPGLRQHALLAAGTLVFALALLAVLLVVRPTGNRALEQAALDARALRDARLEAAESTLGGEPSAKELRELVESLEWAALQAAALREIAPGENDARAAMVRRGLGEREAFDERAAPLQAQAHLRLAGEVQGAASAEQVPALAQAAAADPVGEAGRAARLALARALYAQGDRYGRQLAVQELEDLAGVQDQVARGALLELAQAETDAFDWPRAGSLAHTLEQSGGLPEPELERARRLKALGLSLSPVMGGVPAYDWALRGRSPEGPILVLVSGNAIAVYKIPRAGAPKLPEPEVNWALGGRSLEFPCLADWDGDGRDDLFVALTQSGRTSVGVLTLNTEGSPNFKNLSSSGGSRARVFAAAAGDVNGDGRGDFALIRSDQGDRSEVLIGGGPETQRVPLYSDGVRRELTHIAVADLDGDERAEVLVTAAGHGGSTVEILALDADQGGFTSLGELRVGAVTALLSHPTPDGKEIVLAVQDWEGGGEFSGSPAWVGRDGVLVLGLQGKTPRITGRWTYGEGAVTEASRSATTDVHAWAFNRDGETWIARYARRRDASSWAFEQTPASALSLDRNATAQLSAQRLGVHLIPSRPLCADVDGDGQEELLLGHQLFGAGESQPEPVTFEAPAKTGRPRTLLRVARQLQALGRDQLADETVLSELRERYPESSAARSAGLATVDALLFHASDQRSRATQAFIAAEPKEGARLRTLSGETYTRAAELCERQALAHGVWPQERAAAWAKCAFAYEAAGADDEAIRALEAALAVRNLGPDWSERLKDELDALRRVRDLLPLEVGVENAAASESLGVMRPLLTRLTPEGISLLCSGERMDAALVPVSLGAPLPLELDAQVEIEGNAWAGLARVGVFTTDSSGSMGELTGFQIHLSDHETGSREVAITIGGQTVRPTYRLRPGDRVLRLKLKLRPLQQGGVEAVLAVCDAEGQLISELRVGHRSAGMAGAQLHYAGILSPAAARVNRACVEQPRWAMETRVLLRSLQVRSGKPNKHDMPGIWSAHRALAVGRVDEALQGYQAILANPGSAQRQEALFFRGLARGRRGDANAHQDLVNAASSQPFESFLRLEDLAFHLPDGDPRDLATLRAALLAMENAQNRPLLNAMAQQLRGGLGVQVEHNFADAGRKALVAYFRMRNVSDAGRWRWMNTYRALDPAGRLPRQFFPPVFDPPVEPISPEAFTALLRSRAGDRVAQIRRLSRLRCAEPANPLPLIQLAEVYRSQELHGMAEAILRQTLVRDLAPAERTRVQLDLAEVYRALERPEALLEALRAAKKAGATRGQLAPFESVLGRDPRFQELLGS